MYRSIVLLLFVVGTLANLAFAADKLRVFVFADENQEAMRSAFFKPFGDASGVGVQDDSYDGLDDRFTKSLMSGRAEGDVVQVESQMLEVGCKQGWLEKLDYARIGNKTDFVAGSTSECGVGIYAWSHALLYDPAQVSGTPSSWADFWNLERFPGKRGLRRSAKYTLEIALLADGVAPADVYKTLSTKPGVDRALHKLDEIRNNIVWWQAAPQPPLLLAAKRVVMSSGYPIWIQHNGRGGTLKVVWNGSLHDFDSWAILKRTTRLADAYAFIAFASKPEQQIALVKQLQYGPTNRKALQRLDPVAGEMLPTTDTNLKGALQVDIAFWNRNGGDLERRFAHWAPAQDPTVDELEEEEHHPNKSKTAAPDQHR